ncbi:hypothetical protein HMPREF9554_00579 [Treponema phagedenis F0421]|nr:hypothetical protein HMPREF9554_00579 [Treponema phagedenis F0421]
MIKVFNKFLLYLFEFYRLSSFVFDFSIGVCTISFACLRKPVENFS